MLNILKSLEINKIFKNAPVLYDMWSARLYSKDFRVMTKIMMGGKKRAAWHATPNKSNDLLLTQNINKGPQSKKRIMVLNKLFMKHITDLMATGTMSEQVCGLGVEITKVKVAADYNYVNVYWICNGTELEEKVEGILKRTSGELRQELSNLRLMGNVPIMQFVKDRSQASWSAVESILSKLDLGEDYVPKGIVNLKNDFDNESSLQPSKFLNQFDASENLPPMRQNVFGLNRADIIDRLLSTMKGKNSSKLRKCSTEPLLYEPFNEKAFSEFLLQRKIKKDRMMKENRIPEIEEDEFYETILESDISGEDFIEDEDLNDK